MKHDLRPEWGILRPILLYIMVMIVLAWVGKTYFHMSMFPMWNTHTATPKASPAQKVSPAQSGKF